MESTTSFNPLKVFFCLLPSLCVMQANQSASAQTSKHSKMLMHWFLLNWNHFPFSSSLPSQCFLRRKNLLFWVGDVRCHWLSLRAANHGHVDNTSGKLSLYLFLFFTVKCTLDWQSLGLKEKCLVWKVLSDNSWRADLMHFCPFEIYSFNSFLFFLGFIILTGMIWS